jgi:NitT/TauT family transport system substrate-binding protein
VLAGVVAGVRARSARPASLGGGLLGRPLRVGIVSWPGYAGGIGANNGFRPNTNCIFWQRHKLLVEFVLLEDVETRAKAFSRGGDNGVDVVWSTVDFWAYELPGFLKGGVPARAVMQVDWSRGGDAIVAGRSVQRVEDLKDKRISLALFTPSHWLLESALRGSTLSEPDRLHIIKSLVGKSASPDARADFVAGKVDAAVVWEPDVTEALRQRPDSHVLLSTATATSLIADLMVARQDFIAAHAAVVQAFVQGWLEGAVAANRDRTLAARLLMENEPVYKDLGPAATRDGLTKVRLAELEDNRQMFGLDGAGEPAFDRIFQEAGQAWVRHGYIDSAVPPAAAKDDRFVREMLPAR